MNNSALAYQQVHEAGSQWGIPIHRPGETQLHFLIQEPDHLKPSCVNLREMGYYLVTVIANDERELEDHCFKIYYLFSHPTENIFTTLELMIREGRETYPSAVAIYPAIEAFEREIADLYGLFPEQDQPHPLQQSYLHNSYPEGVHPLRRNWSQETFQNILKDTPPIASIPAGLTRSGSLPEGQLYMPVGPIHAGVIEPGNFLFRISGEMIEQLDLLLGYTHKGIERLYQSNFSILEGSRLAEKASGDTSFAHSLAYCKAAESLSAPHIRNETQRQIRDETQLLRAIFLELERLVNHIGDCGALAHDLALEITASDMAVLREQLMRLCGSLTNSRFLRGINRPGGICLPQPFDKHRVLFTINYVVKAFLEQANALILRSDFRERTIHTGVLTAEAALHLGVTGLAARASGLPRDFRLQHPFGPYKNDEIRDMIQKGAELTGLPLSYPYVMTGDVFSRFVQRVIEVDLSGRLIEKFVSQWGNSQKTDFIEPLDLRQVANYETGLGYVEGWRGDIIYWLMKDKFERIFRCKVRDPSMLNWPGLREAVAPALDLEPGSRRRETALVDFPVINKSFNLSYSGVDL